MKNEEIIFHADDYGINLNQSKRILQCVYNGRCNSISIIPNGKELAECMRIIPENIKKAIHINLVEGFCCGDRHKLKLLVDRNGRFKHGFIGLWVWSIIAPRKMRQQLKIECKAQMANVMNYLPDDYSIRIDSHMHCHMIPAVLDAIGDLCVNGEHDIEYFRWPVEPMFLYFKNICTWEKIRLINVIKVLVINTLSLWDRKYIKKYGLVKKMGTFWGVMLSGDMTCENVQLLQDDFKKYAHKHGKQLEILFHPGKIKKGEYFLDESAEKFTNFYMSNAREAEAKTLCEKCY